MKRGGMQRPDRRPRREWILAYALAIVTMLLYSGSAAADTSFDAGQLGRMRGILDVCARVSPRDAVQYHLHMKALIGDASKSAVDEAKQTAEYRDAYQSTTKELRDMTPAGMVDACSFYLTTAN